MLGFIALWSHALAALLFGALALWQLRNWNVDASLFRTIAFSRYRFEIRAEAQNVFNHAQWGNPVTGFTSLDFMRIRTLARAPRTVQLGARFVF